ncbi:hypothetical protein AV530_010108 [Patagioenas fasciata monilis]|uniref:Uncharacterized protein n=1 Tax=Patagioenas fasciata monilis TaxID=372326 RepID=A0A1V4L0Q9_PATFA|nr:hypothetical protein AV530_010108 [Patagioenas fasciata monilis]
MSSLVERCSNIIQSVNMKTQLEWSLITDYQKGVLIHFDSIQFLSIISFHSYKTYSVETIYILKDSFCTADSRVEGKL